MSLYKDEKYKLEEAFLVLKPSKVLSIFYGKNLIYKMPEISRADDTSDLDGDIILVGSDDIDYNKYVVFSDTKLPNSVQKLKLWYSYLLWVTM